MTNIVLSCSQQKWNQCLVPGCNEQSHTYAIAEATARILKDFDCNVYVIPKIDGTEAFTLNEVVRRSNDFVSSNPATASYHLDIHTDGGYDGSGASGFYYSEGGKAFISKMYNELTKITPWTDGGLTERNLMVLRCTNATAGLIEISFHDKQNEASWVHENVFEIANAIVRGIIKATGLTKMEVKILTIEDAIAKLVEHGVISSPDYWVMASKAVIHLDTLLINMANKLV